MIDSETRIDLTEQLGVNVSVFAAFTATFAAPVMAMDRVVVVLTLIAPPLFAGV